MIVVCFLWGDPKYRFGLRYTADHVNRLNRMLSRSLDDHELVCVTDMPAGIDDDVRIIPLWDDHRNIGGTYVRMKLFSPEMKDLIGDRFALMDLDCVITGPLGPLFDTDAEFVTTRSSHHATLYNTGFFLLKAGARAEVWERFDPPGSLRDIALSGAIGWEQAWVSLVLGEGEKTWGRDDGVYNFRKDVEGRELPADARAVFFPGDYDPSDKGLRKANPWIGEYWC
jgi:hypothetical protein